MVKRIPFVWAGNTSLVLKIKSVSSLNEIIFWLKEIFITPDQMMIAFDAFQHFFKSIIYFSLDIEKLICLDCITVFCVVDRIKDQIFGDKAFVTFMQWCSVYKRLLPGKGYVEVPEFARMRPGDSLEEAESTQANVWDAKLVKAIKDVRFVCYIVSTLIFY